jgi:hypothetical protein
MEITIYKNNSENNSLVKKLSSGHTISGHLVNNSDVVNPTIQIALNTDYFTMNYVHIPSFGRFYFITDMEIDNKCITLKLHCDVVSSFASDIKNSTAHVTRSLRGNRFIKDPLVTTTSKINWQCRKLGSGLPLHNTYVLQVGGK